MPLVLHRKLPRALSLIHDMGHQAEVAFYENVAGLQITLSGALQIMPLFLLRQGPGKTSGGQLQRIQKAAEYQPDR